MSNNVAITHLWYENVCLVLDNDTDNALCTDGKNPDFDGKGESITWKNSKVAQKISLYFHYGSNVPNTHHHAEIANLNIFYKELDIQSWHGDSNIATVDSSGSWEHQTNYVSNMFDNDLSTIWHSNTGFETREKNIGFVFNVSLILYRGDHIKLKTFVRRNTSD